MTETMAEAVIQRFVSERVGPASSPLDDAVGRELTDAHVTQMLDFLQKREDNRHQEATEQHRFRPLLGCVLVVLVLVFVFALTWLSLNFGKTEIILPIVTAICGFAAGAIGGYGYAKSSDGKPAA